jgi:hypothetical protein
MVYFGKLSTGLGSPTFFSCNSLPKQEAGGSIPLFLIRGDFALFQAFSRRFTRVFRQKKACYYKNQRLVIVKDYRKRNFLKKFYNSLYFPIGLVGLSF